VITPLLWRKGKRKYWRRAGVRVILLIYSVPSCVKTLILQTKFQIQITQTVHARLTLLFCNPAIANVQMFVLVFMNLRGNLHYNRATGGTWWKMKYYLIFSSDTLRNMMGFVFWNIILNAEKLSKPGTYPRFVKLAKNIVSRSLSKTSFWSIRVFRKPLFRFLNVYIRCLWTTIVYFAIF
jgi:hypothetical protein